MLTRSMESLERVRPAPPLGVSTQQIRTQSVRARALQPRPFPRTSTAPGPHPTVLGSEAVLAAV